MCPTPSANLVFKQMWHVASISTPAFFCCSLRCRIVSSSTVTSSCLRLYIQANEKDTKKNRVLIIGFARKWRKSLLIVVSFYISIFLDKLERLLSLCVLNILISNAMARPNHRKVFTEFHVYIWIIYISIFCILVKF